VKDTATATLPMASTVVESATATRFVWSGRGGLVRESAAPIRPPLIVDSWLMDDGRVRGLEMHEQRFTGACMRLLPDLAGSTVKAFLGSVRLVLPRTGRWFPRVEVHGRPAPQLAVWLRPAPERSERATLWVAPGGDPRLSPKIKGPDLAVLAALREQAHTEGADDALLCASDGSILEAAHSSLVWWRREVLCLPTAESSILPSVTRRLLLELAQRRGVGVIRERMRPAELGAVETWTLNALHGIRPVSTWLGLTGTLEACPSVLARLREWTAALDELMVPVDNIPTE
jgi:branched-subunit amino acid aminotransferase/4-amino-4-deoxychorismate lyase